MKLAIYGILMIAVWQLDNVTSIITNINNLQIGQPYDIGYFPLNRSLFVCGMFDFGNPRHFDIQLCENGTTCIRIDVASSHGMINIAGRIVNVVNKTNSNFHPSHSKDWFCIYLMSKLGKCEVGFLEIMRKIYIDPILSLSYRGLTGYNVLRYLTVNGDIVLSDVYIV